MRHGSALDLSLDVVLGGLAVGRQNASKLGYVEFQRLTVDRLRMAKGLEAFNTVI